MWGSEHLLLNHTDPRQTPGQARKLGETSAVTLLISRGFTEWGMK